MKNGLKNVWSLCRLLLSSLWTSAQDSLEIYRTIIYLLLYYLNVLLTLICKRTKNALVL